MNKGLIVYWELNTQVVYQAMARLEANKTEQWAGAWRVVEVNG